MATVLRTRSRAPLALVRTYRDGSSAIVGYAHSGSPAVVARARRLSARLRPIIDGKVEVA